MSQPPVYTPAEDFTDYQTNNPGQPMSGASLDIEFNALKTTLDSIRANLALLQRDDTAVANAIIHPDSFTTAALALIASDWTPQGLWVTATAYVVGDIVESDSTSYVCASAHTSGTFATDYAAGKWVVVGFAIATLQAGTSLFAIAGGTADVITGTFTPTIGSLVDGMEVRVRALGTNTIAGVTFNLDGTGAKTVKRYGNQALVVNDIPRADYEMTLRYNSSNDVWELVNPYTYDQMDIGDPGTESSGVNVNGVTYPIVFRVNEFGSGVTGQVVLHRHSTVSAAILLGTRSNSDTSAHADVTTGQVLFTILGGGTAGTSYKLFGAINFLVGTGTVSDTSAPGKVTIQVTPDTSLTPVDAIVIDSDKTVFIPGQTTLRQLPPTTSGTDTYTVTTGFGALETGEVILVNFGTTNTSITPTLNRDGTGALTIKTKAGGALTAGDLLGPTWLYYDGTDYRLTGPAT